MDNYKELKSELLTEDITYRRPIQSLKKGLSMGDPAIDAITDLSVVSAITVNPCASLENVKDRMVASGVRLLLVTNQFHHVTGIITTNDISGPKTMNYMREVGGKIEDIIVNDMMTPRRSIETLSMDDLQNAKVGDLVETLKRMGRQHALITEKDENGSNIIRGIVSASQLSAQLNVEISTSDVASSISDLAAGKSL